MTPIRFGAFEVDAQSGELRRDGKKVKIQEQPFQVLILLVERPGEVLTREELARRLWSEQTNVDFERGLNKAITRLREALRDSAENPRYVETLPRRGYRFIAHVTNGAHGAEVETKSKEVPVTESRTRSPRMAMLASAAVALGLILLAAIGGYLLQPLPHLQSDNLTIVPFTTFPGLEVAPRFCPMGTKSYSPGSVMTRISNLIFTSSRSGRSAWSSLLTTPPDFWHLPGPPMADSSHSSAKLSRTRAVSTSSRRSAVRSVSFLPSLILEGRNELQ